MPARPLRITLILSIATVALGITLRFAHLGQGAFVTKYGGSAMWALMLYWTLSTLLARVAVWRVALLSATLATAVEFFKLYSSPPVDAFRATLAGKLLLGRHFSYEAIVAYCAAIAFGAWFDARLRQTRSRR